MPFRKWSYRILLLTLISAPLFCQYKTTVAVLGLDAHNMSQSDSDLLAGRLRSILVNWDVYDVIERTKMMEILEEHGFQQTGCIADECLLEAGRLLGVQKMIAGSVGRFGDIYTIELRMVDMETAKIEASATYDHEGEMEVLLFTGINTALKKLLAAKGDSGAWLTQPEGTLIIETSPPNATIYLENRSIGKSPKTISQLPKGAYQLELTIDDKHEPFSRAIVIATNDTTRITHTFLPMFGYLSMSIHPPDAMVFVDDDVYHENQMNHLKLNTGQHTVKVFSQSFYPFKKNIHLKKDQILPMDVSLIYGGHDLKRHQKHQKRIAMTTATLLSLNVVSYILANSSYDKYRSASTSAEADRYRKRTEILDKTTFGLSVLTVGFSTATLIKWIQIKRLKHTLGIK